MEKLYLMPGTSYNGREHSTRSIISCKASFAHTGSIVNNEGCNFIIHFLNRKRGGRKGEVCLKPMGYIWQTSSVLKPVITATGRWVAQWRRFQFNSTAKKQRQFLPRSGHGHIRQKWEQLRDGGSPVRQAAPCVVKPQWHPQRPLPFMASP